VDYLLEDEDEPNRGWGKMALVLIALILLGGFGYLRWKQGGFAFLNGYNKPAHAIAPSPNTTDTAATPNSQAPANPPIPVDANPGAANSSAANPASAPPGSGSAPANNSNASAPDGATNSAAPKAAPPTSGREEKSAQTTPPASGTAEGTTPESSSENKFADKSTEADSPEDAEAGPAKPEARPTKPSASRRAERKPSAATPLDPTLEAERYIYGRGVAQDCDRGLRLLKPAATTQSNTGAMILLGTLYSSGTCTPRDLPTAYRWYAIALHKDPDNQRLQDDLQKLWEQMTPPERQLAIKLSH
jgi:hypothetical protein